jgi:hypothetical protein
VPFEDRVEHRAKLDRAAADIEAFDLKRYDVIVAGKIEFAEFGGWLSHHSLLRRNMSTRPDVGHIRLRRVAFFSDSAS